MTKTITTASLPHTVQSLLHDAKEQGVQALDAEILLAESIDLNRVEIYTWPNREVDPLHAHRFLEWIERRRLGEPVAYILGKKEFWSLMLEINSDVLIPRPETELLVEGVLEKVPKNQPLKMLELGTGSGAISVALGKERPRVKIIATDISRAALNIAEKNAKKWSLHTIQWYQGDWFGALSSLKPDEKLFDVIVSNPPYIDACDPHLNTKELTFEPLHALCGGQHGLNALTIIIENAGSYLKPEGWVCVEHGFNQKEAVSTLFTQNNYINIECRQDLSGVNRMTLAQKR